MTAGARTDLTGVADVLAAAGCVHAEEEAGILARSAATPEELDAWVLRRAAGEPLEHLVGWSDFRGLRFEVTEGVFVPRPRSGLLVEQAGSLVRCLSGHGRDVVVVDLCCGVGAIGAALATETAAVTDVVLHAVDIDRRALACAEQNLAAVAGTVHHGDLFSALPRRLRRRIDLVVASPPYVPSAELRLLPTEARAFEAGAALDGGTDGLEVLRRIAGEGRQWLAPHGCLAVEVAETQVEPATALLEELGYPTRAVVSDTYGSAVLTGRRPH